MQKRHAIRPTGYRENERAKPHERLKKTVELSFLHRFGAIKRATHDVTQPSAGSASGAPCPLPFSLGL